MKNKNPVVDYRKLRINNICSSEYRHLLWLIYWGVFGVMFYYAEHYYPVKEYLSVYCIIDDYIPFCELFVIPYMFWFVFLLGIHVYTLFYDIDAFRKLIKYIVITYTAALVLFFIIPTCQELRPDEFARDNFLVRFMQGFYEFDTNTNVCPSLHVIGSMAVLSSALNIERFKTVPWRLFFIISAVLISISTVFLKQHSIIDVIVAIPICALAYIACYRNSATAEVRKVRQVITNE